MKRASYFDVGEIILYGKYKNKKGIIKSFGDDGKGNPTVEIEPIPKGRKQNKTIGLFKIWKQKTPKEAAMSDKLVTRFIAQQRVASRYVRKNAGLNVGETWEDERKMVRIHRYRPSIKMTDLTNAGKRGKTCEQADLYNLDWNQEMEKDADTYATVIQMAAKSGGFKQALKKMEEIDKSLGGGHLQRNPRGKLKGVHTTPAGFSELKVDGENIRVESGFESWVIRDKVDRNNEPTCISKGSRKSIAQMYRWVKDNLSKLQKMTYQQAVQAISNEGIEHHSYCAMD